MIDGYAVTAEDWLWLLRAVAAEGPPEAQVARALVNLHALVRSRGGGHSLASLVRAYAQPVNPAWMHGGERDADPAEVSAAERRRARAASAEAFSPEVVLAVHRALSRPYASDVTDYAAPSVDASRKGYEPRSEPRGGENRFWSRAPGWRGYGVSGMTVDERIAAIRSIARGLPAPERVQWSALMDRVEAARPAAVGALLDGVRVIRPGEPGYEEAKRAAQERDAKAPVEWDLALANWLDKAHGAVAQRAEQLAEGAASVARASLPWALILGLVVLWAVTRE